MSVPGRPLAASADARDAGASPARGGAHRAGHVAIVGRPNVGKSTLLNRLVGQKLSIVSRKPQTTRHPVTGIVTRPGNQLVFVDTPGFQTRHGGPLNRSLNRAVTDSLGGVDVVLLVVEAGRYEAADAEVVRQLPRDLPVVLAVNKIDRVADKARLLPFLDRIQGAHPFAEIVPVSGAAGTQCDLLLDALARHVPEGPALYSEDELTDRSERFLAAELVREKVFRLTGDELPHQCDVVVERFETEGALRRIACLIVVARPSQKGMVIGARGERLREIGTAARQDMERLFGGRVWLDLHVKVEKDWMDDPAALRKHGYL